MFSWPLSRSCCSSVRQMRRCVMVPVIARAAGALGVIVPLTTGGQEPTAHGAQTRTSSRASGTPPRSTISHYRTR